jgi:site-specific recombinase XerD
MPHRRSAAPKKVGPYDAALREALATDARRPRRERRTARKLHAQIMRRVARRAGVQKGVHILRHTFCSHLAMRVHRPGHRDLGTTQRYMHLSPAALEAAIRLLERGEPVSRGANGEAAGTSA